MDVGSLLTDLTGECLLPLPRDLLREDARRKAWTTDTRRCPRTGRNPPKQHDGGSACFDNHRKGRTRCAERPNHAPSPFRQESPDLSPSAERRRLRVNPSPRPPGFVASDGSRTSVFSRVAFDEYPTDGIFGLKVRGSPNGRSLHAGVRYMRPLRLYVGVLGVLSGCTGVLPLGRVVDLVMGRREGATSAQFSAMRIWMCENPH